MTQMVPDPSSDVWYWAWWQFLLAGEEVSEPRFKSKGNAELRAQSACKNYLQETDEVRLHFPHIPTCSVLLATDSSVFALVDFPDLLNAMEFNHIVPLLETFGKWFASSGYDGAVIFRSPWTTGDSPTRVYQMYAIRSIAFWWDEVNSGVREEISAALELRGDKGQSDRDVFSPALEAKDTLNFREATILRITPLLNGYSLMDLTDGSEWSIAKETQNGCNLNEGIEVSIFSLSGGKPPSLKGLAPGKRDCPLNAVFVKGW